MKRNGNTVYGFMKKMNAAKLKKILENGTEEAEVLGFGFNYNKELRKISLACQDEWEVEDLERVFDGLFGTFCMSPK